MEDDENKPEEAEDEDKDEGDDEGKEGGDPEEKEYASVQEVIDDNIGDEGEADKKYSKGIDFVNKSNDPNKDKIIAVLEANRTDEIRHKKDLESLKGEANPNPEPEREDGLDHERGGSDGEGDDEDEKKAMGLMGL